MPTTFPGPAFKLVALLPKCPQAATRVGGHWVTVTEALALLVNPVGVAMTTPYTIPSNESLYLCFLENGTFGTTQLVLTGGNVFPALLENWPNGSATVKQTGQTTLIGASLTFVVDASNIWFGWN